MEENIQSTDIAPVRNSTAKQPWMLAHKKFLLLFTIFFSISLVAATALIVFHTQVTVNVVESISTNTTTLTISGVAGDIVIVNLSVHNAANQNVSINFDYDQISATNDTVHIIPMTTATTTVKPGDNIIPLTFQIGSDSTTGFAIIDVSVSRA